MSRGLAGRAVTRNTPQISYPADHLSLKGIAIRLTTKERVLLHLLDYTRYADEIEVPKAVTQEGICEAAWFLQPHFVQYVHPLLEEELVRERKAHVKGVTRRRKVYTLTASGRIKAAGLRNRLDAEVVRVRDAEGVREVSIREAVKESGGGLRPLEIFRRARDEGVVDLIAAAETPSEFVEMTAEAPRVPNFVGRQRELQALTQGEGPRMAVVRGVAGIGKSSLAAQACELLRGERNLLWHRAQPWDTVASLLADVGRFLAALGQPGLRAALAEGSADVWAQVLREDLPGTRSFLVFDDVHEAGPEVLPFFRLLKDVVAEAPDVGAIVLSRRALPFYDRRDVALAGTVLELELAGLTPEEVGPLLPATGERGTVELSQEVGGHPLFFELVRAHPTPSAALGDLRRFMEQEIYAELTEEQRAMMKLASQYRVAIPREALFFGSALTHDVLLSLTERSLIRDVGEDRFGVHDTIRDFFAELQTPTERLEYGAFALTQLRDLAEEALAAKDPVTALGSLANALELVEEDGDRRALLEAFGDTTAAIGDLSGALVAYERAMNLGPEGDAEARLHRKAGALLEDRGDLGAATAELDAALAALGDAFTEERGWVYTIRALVAREMDDLEEAQEYGEEALRVFRTLEVPQGEAQALLELGYVDYISPTGNATRAEERLRAALALMEGLGDPVLVAGVRIVLANVIGYEGRPEEGLEYLATVESTPGAMSDPRIRRSYLEMKGLIAQLLDAEEAEEAFRESIELASRIGDRITEVISSFGRAWVHLHRREYEEARARIEDASSVLKARGVSGGAIEVHFYGALCALLQNDLEGFREALAWLEDPALSQGREVRYPRIQMLWGLGRLLDGDEAGMEEAFEAALGYPRMQWAFHAHFLYGVALVALGKEEAGADHLEKARDLARTHRWDLPLAAMPEMESRLVKVLRGELPPRPR